MNELLTQETTQLELSTTTVSMAKGKPLGQDKISIGFFQQLWLALSFGSHQIIMYGNEVSEFHKGLTKGSISLIPKEGDTKDLNYQRPTTLFTTIYKIFTNTFAT